MITLSLCMIVRNEEGTLGKCLDSVKDIMDEIIIVDTGSTDRTKEKARKFTDKIFDFEWINDFSAARNFSFKQATMDYIIWLDADDVILPTDAAKLIALKHALPEKIDVIMLKYNTGFDSQGKVTFSYFRERLLKRRCFFLWKEPVHEYLAYFGNIMFSNICVTHTKQHQGENTRNINIYEELLNNNEELSPRGMYYYARELKEHGRYNEAINWFSLFLDSGKGCKEDNISACGELARCHQALNKKNDALAAMLRSFSFDTPRAEICCQMGYYFKMLKKYKSAVFWFELILNLKKPENNLGFCQCDCWDYIPCLECSICYDKLGNYEKAAQFNEKAAVYRPNSPVVLHNREYFSDRLKKK